MSSEQRNFFHLSTYIPMLFIVMFVAAMGVYFIAPMYFTGLKSNPITMTVGLLLMVSGTTIVIATEMVKTPFISLTQKKQYRDFMHGMYRFSRHPITVGFLTMFFGVGFVLNSFSFVMMGLVLFVLLAAILVPKYEKAMVALSSTYDEYRRHVRRWI